MANVGTGIENWKYWEHVRGDTKIEPTLLNIKLEIYVSVYSSVCVSICAYVCASVCAIYS